MAGFTRSVRIDRDLDTVWAVFLDVERLREWVPSVVSRKQIGTGSVRFGTRFEETRRIDGSEYTAEIEVSDFSAKRLYAETLEKKGIRATYTFRFVADDGSGGTGGGAGVGGAGGEGAAGAGTRVEFEAEVTGSGLARFAVSMVVASMEGADGEALKRLKAVVERA